MLKIYFTGLPVFLAMFFICGPALPFQPADLDEALEQATKAAVNKVSPCIVQIRTVGGLETVGGGKGPAMLHGQGPTTGVIVDPNGYIISSSFNFAHKPSGITVYVPSNKEPLAAKVVAHDKTRMLTLLKIEATGLPVPTAAPKSEVQLGQWSLALGRTLSETGYAPPSVSVGIVSAKDRVWGKAIQTDAKVSPVNYGGPLIDLSGRVIGILVPMDPRHDGETAGVEWYDGGIGFAVPLEDINRVLPKLKQGKDVEPGILGINLKSQDLFSGPPAVGYVRSGTTAAKAGLQADDQIIEADGRKMERLAQLRHVLGNKSEGDKISLKIKRGDKEIDLPNLELTGPPAAHLLAFLGILPMRDDDKAGVEIRYVFPQSPADKAKLAVGDRITKVEERPIRNRNQLISALDAGAPGQQLKLEVRRKAGDKAETITVTLAEMSDIVPEELAAGGTYKKALAKPQMPMGLPIPPMGQPPRPPVPVPPQKPAQEKPAEPKKEAKKGFYAISDPTTGHGYWVYVPEDYDPNISYSLIVWLHPKGDAMQEPILRVWRDICKERHFILLGPKAENPTGWLTSEADVITADIRELLANYTIDRQRIVLHGHGQGANLAYFLAFDARDLVRGVANVGGVPPAQLKENAAHERLAFFLLAGAKDPEIEAIRAARPRLIEKKFSVVYHEIEDQGSGYLVDADYLRELVRWIDSLDRI
jgi:S1-C subfamily serine protease/predicted esterase